MKLAISDCRLTIGIEGLLIGDLIADCGLMIGTAAIVNLQIGNLQIGNLQIGNLQIGNLQIGNQIGSHQSAIKSAIGNRRSAMTWH